MICRFFVSVLALIMASANVYCQENVIDGKTKFKKPVQHTLGFGYTNSICFPEKIEDKTGRIELVPFPKYGFELTFKYGLIFHKIVGIDFETIVGSLSTGQSIKVNGGLEPYSSIPSDFKMENAIELKSSRLDMPYGGVNVTVHTRNKLGKHVDISPRLGFKLCFPFGVTEGGAFYTTANGAGVLQFFSWQVKETNRLRWVPDLQVGVNFLIHPRHPKHNLVVGSYINLGFVDRAVGSYRFYNLGPANESSGRVTYTSSYVGIVLAYEFTITKRSKPRKEREEGDKIEFKFSM